MKGNKGKEVTSEGARHEVESQVRPSTGDKRKTLSKNLDLENLPSRQLCMYEFKNTIIRVDSTPPPPARAQLGECIAPYLLQCKLYRVSRLPHIDLD